MMYIERPLLYTMYELGADSCLLSSVASTILYKCIKCGI